MDTSHNDTIEADSRVPLWSRRAVLFAVLRLSIVYVVAASVLLARPTAFIDLLRPVLPVVVRTLDGEYELQETTVEGEQLVMTGLSHVMRRFKGPQGQPGPEYGLRAKHLLSVINVYPVIILSLISVWPMSWRARVAALLIGLLFAGLLACVDCSVMFFWCARELYGDAWAMVGHHVPGSPEKQAAIVAIQAGFERLRIVKSFYSTGGRQFLSVLAAMLSLLPLFLTTASGRSRRRRRGR